LAAAGVAPDIPEGKAMPNEEMVQIGNKWVQLSEPYVAQTTELVGRNEELRAIVSAWLASPPMSPLLVGLPGLGKNRVAYEISRLTGKDLYILQGHEDLRADDLACVTRISDTHRIDYLLTPLTSAMIRGALCLVDEIGKIRADAFALLASLLDDRRYMDSTVLGARIHAAPGFRFLAATNTVDLDGKRIPDFIESRLKPVVNFRPSPREEIDQIARTRYPAILQDASELLEVFWDEWRKQTKGRSFPTPRHVVQVFALALGVAHGTLATARTPGNIDLNGNGKAPVKLKRKKYRSAC